MSKSATPVTKPTSATYKDTLDNITKARYEEKLKFIGGIDPYVVGKGEWKDDVTKWPEVTYPDIVNYLVYTQSAYTLAELKAYKSLQSYNYFVSGFVQKIGHLSKCGKSVLLGKVKHSQRMNDASLLPWVITEEDGSVVCGHCTCMAGAGEVCSHVGALLFAIEAAIKIRNSKTVTQEKAYWLLPSSVSKVDYKTIQDIDFTSAKTKKKQLDSAIANSTPSSGLKQRKLPNVKEPTEDELSSLYARLDVSGKRSAVLSLVPGYAAKFKPKVLQEKYPTVLSDLYDDSCASLPTDQVHVLQQHAETVFRNLKVTAEEAANCEMDTRDQSSSKQWHSFRTGRITASRVKAACRTSLDKPSVSLNKDICYPMSRTFSSRATRWGCDHESDARKQYAAEMSDKHTNFQVRESGLVINPLYPYMGASPDGIASCDCCGTVAIEIKCPYCRRHCEIDNTVDCLRTVDGKLSLDNNHQYYYQVQCQLLLTGHEFCDFVVWTEKDLFLERIQFDEEFCNDMISKCEAFFKTVLLPELIGKCFSRPFMNQSVNSVAVHAPADSDRAQAPADNNNNKELIICSCQTAYNASEDVIGCDDQNCPYVWLHFKCAGIKRVPKGTWFCKHCRQKRRPKNTTKK